MYIVAIALVVIIVIFIVKSQKTKAKIKAEQLEQERRKEEERQRKLKEEAEKKAQEELEYQKARDKRKQIDEIINQNPLASKYRVEDRIEVKYKILDTDEFMKVAPKNFVVVDLETTGLDPYKDKIVEIAAVKVKNCKIISSYTQLIDPECSISPEASVVNNITDDMLVGMPKIYEIMPDFLDFAGHNVLVAHNAKFDSGFIAQACMKYSFNHPKRYYDSMSLKEYWPEAKGRKLSALLQAAGIENEESHRALGDATALAKLTIASVQKLQDLENKNS